MSEQSDKATTNVYKLPTPDAKYLETIWTQYSAATELLQQSVRNFLKLPTYGVNPEQLETIEDYKKALDILGNITSQTIELSRAIASTHFKLVSKTALQVFSNLQTPQNSEENVKK
jgi:hypothetical protein